MPTFDCDVWILMDSEGNHVASHDPDRLGDLYTEDIGGDFSGGLRRVKVTVSIPHPVALEARATVPAEPAAEPLTTAEGA